MSDSTTLPARTRDAYLPPNITRERLEAWLGESTAKFASRCDHAAKMCWRHAKGDRVCRENNLRASRGLANFAQALREFDADEDAAYKGTAI